MLIEYWLEGELTNFGKLMFDTSIEKTIVLTAVALWFAHGWYLNTRLNAVHKKLDALMEGMDKFLDPEMR
jgi:hypothetical protein